MISCDISCYSKLRNILLLINRINMQGFIHTKFQGRNTWEVLILGLIARVSATQSRKNYLHFNYRKRIYSTAQNCLATCFSIIA